jgi:short-subunit dehydrogenase
MIQPSYALVTGASRGLGKVFAQTLAARKHNVVLVARSKDQLEALAKELRISHGILAESLEFDLASPIAGLHLAQQLRDRELRINLLVNNAGFGARGEFWKLSLERQLEMIHLNNEAIVELTFHLLPPMIEQRHGGIINVSSTASFQPIPYANLYAATKSFLTTFSLGLEQELRPIGVAVVTVCPGRIRKTSQTEGSQSSKRTFPEIYQSPEDVVRKTLRALDRGGGLVVPGFLNKLSDFAARLIPRRMVPKLVAKMSRP